MECWLKVVEDKSRKAIIVSKWLPELFLRKKIALQQILLARNLIYSQKFYILHQTLLKERSTFTMSSQQKTIRLYVKLYSCLYSPVQQPEECIYLIYPKAQL